jgi:hypothetical protein
VVGLVGDWTLERLDGACLGLGVAGMSSLSSSSSSSSSSTTTTAAASKNENGSIKSAVPVSIVSSSSTTESSSSSSLSSSFSSSSDSSSLLSPLKRLLGSSHGLDADEVALVAKLVEEATSIPVSTSVLAAPPPPPPGPPPADAMRMTPIIVDQESPQGVNGGAQSSTLLALEASEMRVSVLDAKLKQQVEERIEENKERNALVESLTSELEQLRGDIERERIAHTESTSQMRKDFEAELADVAKRPSKTQMEH